MHEPDANPPSGSNGLAWQWGMRCERWAKRSLAERSELSMETGIIWLL